MEKAPDFKLEHSDNPERELIKLVSETTDFESLANLAFDNTRIGYIFNPLRYEHLKEVKGADFTTEYPDYDREDGYLIGPEGKTTRHITQEYHEHTDEIFYEKNKPMIIEFLSFEDKDLEKE